MQRIGFFQTIFTPYKTSTNKDRIKKQYIFLEEITTTSNSSLENVKACQEVFKRYSAYNNVFLLDYDDANGGYIKSKSKNVSIRLDTIKGVLQDGEKIKLVRRW